MKRWVTVFLAGVFATGSVAAGEWTGAYGGVSLGNTDVNSSATLDGSNTAFGLHVGYDHDFGDFVLGGEVEYDPSNIQLGGGAASVNNTGRFKLRTGYDFGLGMGYLVLGGARLDTSAGSDTGVLYGAGVAIDLGNGFTLSGEGLHHDFNNFKGLGADIDTNSVSLRASFRF